MTSTAPLEIRFATAADATAVAELAALDETAPLQGVVLVARAHARPVAALALEDGRVAADPFVATADAVELLRLRGRQERSAPRRGRLARRVRLVTA